MRELAKITGKQSKVSRCSYTVKYDETWGTSDSILNERSAKFSVSLKKRKNREIQSCRRETKRKCKKSCDPRPVRESWQVCVGLGSGLLLNSPRLWFMFTSTRHQPPTGHPFIIRQFIT